MERLVPMEGRSNVTVVQLRVRSQARQTFPFPTSAGLAQMWEWPQNFGPAAPTVLTVHWVMGPCWEATWQAGWDGSCPGCPLSLPF